MATRTSLHLQASKDLAMPFLIDWLKSANQTSNVITEEETDLPLSLYQEKFINSEQAFPTILVVGQTQPDWLSVYYNSFYAMQDFALEFSAKFKCLVVVYIMQSIADANYLAIYNDGKSLRTICCVAGDWEKNQGEPLSFEIQPLGRNIAPEGESEFFVFDEFESEKYCENFELKLWVEESSNWTILSVPNKKPDEYVKKQEPRKISFAARILRALGLKSL